MSGFPSPADPWEYIEAVKQMLVRIQLSARQDYTPEERALIFRAAPRVIEYAESALDLLQQAVKHVECSEEAPCPHGDSPSHLREQIQNLLGSLDG